jgi:hypothetical protein
MIFRIEVKEEAIGWRVRITSPDAAGWLPIERIGALDPNGYPLPPEAEIPAPTDPWQPLCEPNGTQLRKDALDRFVRQDPRAGQQDVEALGGYLFAVLLGKDWSSFAKKGNAEPVRLRLTFPENALWHQLPWELMIGPDGPLAASGNPVSITRLLVSEHTSQKLSIEIPIRVLFAVGRELDDQLRSGAEYLSVLRQLQCTFDEGQDAIGVALHTRLLMEATSEDIQNAVAEFKPTVVHLIAHGQVIGKESVVLLTRYEGLGRRNPKADPVSGDRLAKVLQASNPDVRPDAVVLNACNTARIGDVSESFAAELVRQGIPLVVGMAGEVADSACRLFTRQFYSALVEQEPADIAASKGRRAALLHFKNYKQNFDWGRAIFCQAEGVETQFEVISVQQSLIRAAENLRPKRIREPFCGRLSWLPLFRDLFKGTIGNLAIESEEEISDEGGRPQLGKSRLLQEVAWHSVFEGWIPVLVDQDRPRFSNLMHFGVSLFELLEKTRETFGLPRKYQSDLVRVACERWNVAYVPGQQAGFLLARDKVLTALEPQQKITTKVTYDTIFESVRTDLRELRKEVEAVGGPRKGVLLLWDQLDNQEAIGEDCVRSLHPHGLGSMDCPAPVIFTYAGKSTGGKKLLGEMNRNSNIEKRNLARFDKFENGMACRQFLAWKKYVPSQSKRDAFEQSMGVFEDEVDGYPSKLFCFDQGIKVLFKQQVLIECDDALILEQYK